MKNLFLASKGLLMLLFLSLAACDSGGGGGPSGPLTIVAMGDSITGDVNYPGAPPWPVLLGSMKAEWTVINAGKGNERAATGAGKVGGLMSRYKPDVLVVMYGSANTINRDTNRIKEQIRSILRSGKAGGAKVLVCTCPPMSKGRGVFQSEVERVNTRIRELAREENVTLVDVANEFTGTAVTERFPDGLHPDLDGQRIIAMAVREKL